MRLRRIPPHRRLGLRARLTLTYALGAALLSAFLAVTTFGLTRENLLQQREDTAVSRAYVNAATVRTGLGPAVDMETLIGSLPTPEGAQPVIQYHDEWNAKNAVEFSKDTLPQSLRDEVAAGTPARMRFQHNGQPYLAVGVPIPAADAAYYEIVSLAEAQRTLENLAITLIGASLLTIMAGGLLGWWAARPGPGPAARRGHRRRGHRRRAPRHPPHRGRRPRPRRAGRRRSTTWPRRWRTASTVTHASPRR